MGIVQELMGYGYHVGAPTEKVFEMDSAVVADWPCDECGGKMRYVPLVDSERTYIAVAICYQCGNEVEF